MCLRTESSFQPTARQWHWQTKPGTAKNSTKPNTIKQMLVQLTLPIFTQYTDQVHAVIKPLQSHETPAIYKTNTLAFLSTYIFLIASTLHNYIKIWIKYYDVYRVQCTNFSCPLRRPYNIISLATTMNNTIMYEISTGYTSVLYTLQLAEHQQPQHEKAINNATKICTHTRSSHN